ncbi:BMP family ABC transporter substrate-binding protein [Rhizobium sp. DKSPLA3]|uniref:BMP family ABC transporter substrate-binding protein n=1 Tax=Rhizobium quercicola TaxID=2901226 RepID=A0A9X1T5M0_9HYPH|nr:BMP family ABC transporter substrate-binding protein [Rhizobium quercicola]MCD7107878.1 BMP family ABC transporter substrate-binding protein [Rhizobium quercicola]
MKIFARFLAAGVVLAASALPSVAAEKVHIAAISGYFAQGFGISIVNGLNKAKDDFGIDLKLVDTGNRALDYEEQFANLAKSGQYDLIFVMGWELVDALQKVGAQYPNQRFVFIDGVLDAKTMVYANFAEEQGSFIAGALAGLVEDMGPEFDKISDGKAIGFVGGRDIPVIRNFLGGYEQGAKYAAPDVKVNSVFAGTFDDPAKGSELAMALYGQGADIVYNVAGPTGEGVMQASAAADKYSLGVDIDMCSSAPGNVLASMLKRGDVAVYAIIKDEVEGRKVMPGTRTFDLASGGVEVKVCDDVAAKLPAAIKDKLEAIRTDVIAGKIQIARAK